MPRHFIAEIRVAKASTRTTHPKTMPEFRQMTQNHELHANSAKFDGWPTVLPKSRLMEVCLSARGLSQVAFGSLPLDFSFLVGDHEYRCSSILASFISPKVAALLKADSLVDSFRVVNVPDKEHEFENVMKLMNGVPIVMTDFLVDYLAVVGTQLGNSELVELSGKQPKTPLSVENVCARLARKIEIGLPFEEEIDFLSENISDVDESQLMQFDSSILFSILGSSKLRIDSEGWLLNLVCAIVAQKGPAYQMLFATVHYDNLTEDEMRLFVESFHVEHMSGAIWDALTQRLIRKVSKAKSEAMKILSEGAVCSPQETENFNGIISLLKTTMDKEIPNNEILEVTSSSANEAHPPEFAIDFADETSYFESLDEPDSWIGFDFKSRRVSITHYALRTWFWPAGYQHLKSWVLEGSDDGQEWTELDRREDCPHLNNSSAVRRFKCELRVKCRHIRLRAIGQDHFNTNLVILSGFELYGRLTSPQP